LYFADEDGLYNPRLHRPVPWSKDGIPDMLIEDAEDVTDAEHERLMAKAATDGVKPNFELLSKRRPSCPPQSAKYSTPMGMFRAGSGVPRAGGGSIRRFQHDHRVAKP